MNFFKFGKGPAKVEIKLDKEELRASHQMQNVEAKKGKGTMLVPVYPGSAPISGTVVIRTNKPVEHIGIKIEHFGVAELLYDRSKQEFSSIVRELAPPGVLSGKDELTFAFKNVEKPYESYEGINVNLRYFVRVTITRSYNSNITKEKHFWIQRPVIVPEINNHIKMEVGIEDCLHIEFEYNKSKYHLNDIVIGKIFFLLVRIKIKHMELAIVKREQAGSGSNVITENETMSKFEIMDGAPVRGESIPVRLFLSSFPLVPTQRDVCNKFSVRFYLNLVLVDEEERRYFKQQEITIWRKAVDEK